MSNWKNDWIGFFLVYFKWSYYLCVSPFRFEWDERNKKFKIGRNRGQAVASAGLYVLLSIWYIKDLRKIPIDYLYKNPEVYFTLAFNMNAIYYHIGVLATSFWRRQDRFLAIVNFDCGDFAICTVKRKLVAVFLCFLFAILPLIYSICGYSVISSSQIWDPSLMFRCLIDEGRFAFFLNGTVGKLATDSCSKYVPQDLNEISILDAILGIFAFLMETSRQIVGFYSDFFPLICCLSIWTSTETLREFLKVKTHSPEKQRLDSFSTTTTDGHLQHNQQSYHQYYYRPRLSLVDDVTLLSETNSEICNNMEIRSGITLPNIATNLVPAAGVGVTSAPVVSGKAMQQKETLVENGGIGGCRSGALLGGMLLERYEVCKSFSRIVNQALGQLLFAYVLSSIMYLSTCMDAVLVLQDWFGKLRVAFFFLIFILMFFIGSEIVNKVYGVRAWLSDSINNDFLPQKDLLVLIHEVTSKSIGVTGNGMFTITYSTFMTVMTTTVTFFIIILQFQKPRGEWEDLSLTINTLNMSLNNLITLIRQLPSQIQSGNMTMTGSKL